MKRIRIVLILSLFIILSCKNKNTADSDLKRFKNYSVENKINKMTTLPSTNNPIVLRTDFSNDNEWTNICKEISTPDPEFGFLANVEIINDKTFENISEEIIINNDVSNYNHNFIFIVDKNTIANSEHPILCLGVNDNKGLKMRTIPSEMWGIENNLSIANMDFEDFSNATDKDGIFRGFK